MELSRRRRNPFVPTAQRIGTSNESFRPVPLAGLDAGLTEDAAVMLSACITMKSNY